MTKLIPRRVQKYQFGGSPFKIFSPLFQKATDFSVNNPIQSFGVYDPEEHRANDTEMLVSGEDENGYPTIGTTKFHEPYNETRPPVAGTPASGAQLANIPTLSIEEAKTLLQVPQKVANRAFLMGYKGIADFSKRAKYLINESAGKLFKTPVTSPFLKEFGEHMRENLKMIDISPEMTVEQIKQSFEKYFPKPNKTKLVNKQQKKIFTKSKMQDPNEKKVSKAEKERIKKQFDNEKYYYDGPEFRGRPKTGEGVGDVFGKASISGRYDMREINRKLLGLHKKAAKAEAEGKLETYNRIIKEIYKEQKTWLQNNGLWN